MLHVARRIAIRGGLVFGLLASGVALAAPAYAYTDPIGGGFVQFINQNSGQCMGLPNGVVTPGTHVIQWPCNGHLDQFWSPVATDDTTQVYQSEAARGECLSVSNNSTAAGAAIVIVNCDGGTAQQWTNHDTFAGRGQPVSVLTNDFTGMVLAVAAASTSNGAPLIQWPGTTNDRSQEWHH